MGCFSLVFIVAFVSGFFQYADGIKPQMTPDKDTLFLNQYDELKIECYSKDARLKFSFPEPTFLLDRSEHEIHVSENGTYSFLRRHAAEEDAGWYACAEEGVEIDNDFRNVNHMDKDVSWIHVYVMKTDSKYHDGFAILLATFFTTTIISPPGSIAVIPCRTTPPRMDVELWQDLDLANWKKRSVRYDPKIGFMLEQAELWSNRGTFQCGVGPIAQTYILLRSESRPTMITPEHDKDVILQAGDVLRIECSSESKLSFLYPTILTNSSKYEIIGNENGTSTFLRQSVISDDTGWYGCAGIDIKNNDIPAYSINTTKKEIIWVYVYVNSSVKIISPLVDTISNDPSSRCNYVVIPCRPTTPESHIQLEEWNGKIWDPQLDSPFDPKVGYYVKSCAGNEESVYRCAMTEPVAYVSENYSFADLNAALKRFPEVVILDVDNPSNSHDFIIRMTGDDLRMRCEMVASASSIGFMEWSVPNTVSADRMKYNLTLFDSRIDFNVLYLQRSTLEITVTNLSEIDSGEYMCIVRPDVYIQSDSRTVEVFDKAGRGYLRLGNKVNYLFITGRKGETIKWLLDLTDFPSAAIYEYGYQDEELMNIGYLFEIQTASRDGAPLLLFSIRNVTTAEMGRYRIFFDYIDDDTHQAVHINVDVQEPPTARLNSTRGLTQTGEMRIDAHCRYLGSPEPNVTIAIEECPKYPSLRNCNLKYGQRPRSYDDERDGWWTYHWQFNNSMSGILSCKACNILGCSVATKDIRFSASDAPYFTSTNLNKTEVVLEMVTRGSSNTIVLECYAAGNPYPNVTWSEDGVKLNDSRQHKFAFDNRELSITYYFGDEGGRYACRAENVHGFVENHIDIRLQGSSDQNNIFLLIVIVTLLVLIVFGCIVIYKLHVKLSRKRLSDLAFEKGALDRFNPKLSVIDQADLLPYDLKWEYPRGLLKFGKTLGSGAFGIVKKAEAKSICRGEVVTTVAVKLVRSTASLNFMTALTRELKILAYLGKHPNVVNLLGACTKNVFYGELYVIVEYCRFGNLRDYLLNGRDDFVDQISVVCEDVDSSSRSLDHMNTTDNELNTNVDVGEGSSATERRCQGTNITVTSIASDDDGDRDQDSGDAQRLRSKYEGDSTNLDVEPISTRDLVYWSWQVSRGMEFLGQRKIVHGDLAARNILLSDNGIVKVCDFGLAKALYKEAEYRDTGTNLLPVKWMAIESIKDQVFSVQSDVWSFGIVMWEIFSLGETPYPGMRQRSLIQKLIDGYRMGHPKYAVTTIYDMMQTCWDADPAKRPSFADLSQNLGDQLDYDFKTQYLEMHAHYMEMNAEIADDEKADYLTLSVDATSASRTQEQIEMNSLPRNVSETPESSEEKLNHP